MLMFLLLWTIFCCATLAAWLLSVLFLPDEVQYLLTGRRPR